MSDDLTNYEITPEDMGCMGEQEIDPGVIESAVTSGSGPSSPISPCFEKIPMEKRKAYRKLYDGFTVKDMSFEDFCIEMCMISSPTMMKHDLEGIISAKHAGHQRMAANKHAIDQSMN